MSKTRRLWRRWKRRGSAHPGGLSNGDTIIFSHSANGLVPGRPYLVTNTTAHTFQVVPTWRTRARLWMDAMRSRVSWKP